MSGYANLLGQIIFTNAQFCATHRHAKIMYISCLFVLTFVVTVQGLKCRTREHMKQQQDFYNLASNCMKSSMNLTTSTGGSWDTRQNRPQSGSNRHESSTHESNRQQENRYDRNKMNFANNNPNDVRTQQNVCPDEYYYNNNNNNNNNNNAYKDESPHYQRHKEKRDAVTVQKYNRKNSTNIGSKNKSPLEEIGSCVIHCIFREMKMLNSDNKADRIAMTNVMTGRIRDPELKEFIQDSIEECFDIMDTEQLITDSNEEHCDFSKKLILCLEEKAKRGCEDWEIRENSTSQTDFNFKEEDDRTRNENQNTNQNAYFNSNNKFNGRYPNFSMGQRRT